PALLLGWSRHGGHPNRIERADSPAYWSIRRHSCDDGSLSHKATARKAEDRMGVEPSRHGHYSSHRSGSDVRTASMGHRTNQRLFLSHILLRDSAGAVVHPHV